MPAIDSRHQLHVQEQTMQARHWLTAALLAFAATVHAQTPAPQTTLADGEVRKVDLAQAKVTLKHGPIASLDMPGMTMVFKVSDPKLLDGLKPGDKVRFAASSVNGNVTVTAIEPVR